MDRKIILTGTFLGITAIVLGAFGAHALKQILTAEQLITFETGVKYQMYHALFLLLVGLLPNVSDKAKNRIFGFVVTGVLFFSGSIYLLATNDHLIFNAKKIGFITPIGGLLLIVGWICLFIDFWKKKA